MSFNSSLNPDVVLTDLDGVFYPEFNIQEHPGYATANTASVFNQERATSSAVIMELFGGVGAWEATAEEANLPQGDPRISEKKTFTVTKFAKMVKIPKEFYDDQMHGAYENMVKSFAQRARSTRDKNAFAMFRNGFTTELTADGVAWFSDSHTNKVGMTVDNKSTGALTDSVLNNLFVQLAEQVGQDGEIDGHVANVLLVPIAAFKNACEITKSTLKSGTANNDMNYYSELYPGLMIYTSPYLGAAAGGSDTACFLLSRNHSGNRYVRDDISTNLVDYSFSDNDVYKYKGRFREVVGAMSYNGAVATTGV